jgi:hypothetical protein
VRPRRMLAARLGVVMLLAAHYRRSPASVSGDPERTDHATFVVTLNVTPVFERSSFLERDRRFLRFTRPERQGSLEGSAERGEAKGSNMLDPGRVGEATTDLDVAGLSAHLAQRFDDPRSRHLVRHVRISDGEIDDVCRRNQADRLLGGVSVCGS